jgi:hypothetical protein
MDMAITQKNYTGGAGHEGELHSRSLATLERNITSPSIAC